MQKRIWIDTETGGLGFKNPLLQLAYMIELDGRIEEKGVLYAGCFPGDILEAKALEVNGMDPKEVKDYPPPMESYDKFCSMLQKYVEPYDKKDKLHFVGYNARFDMDRLRDWFAKAGDKYFGSWFWFPPLCVMDLAAFYLQRNRAMMPNFKLQTVAEALNIKVEPERFHKEPLYDIEITREIYAKFDDWGS